MNVHQLHAQAWAFDRILTPGVAPEPPTTGPRPKTGSEASIEASNDALLDALLWYYEAMYDGPETVEPGWVYLAREALADSLVGRSDAETRHEAVWDAIHQYERGGTT